MGVKRERERVVGHRWHDGDSCEIQQLRQTSPGCLAATRDSSSYPSVFHSWIHSFFLLCSRWTSLCREGEIMMRAVSLCVSWTFRHCCGSLLAVWNEIFFGENLCCQGIFFGSYVSIEFPEWILVRFFDRIVSFAYPREENCWWRWREYNGNVRLSIPLPAACSLLGGVNLFTITCW